MASRQIRVTAAEQRRAELAERAERRRLEIARDLESSAERLEAAAAFVRRWSDVSRERAESQSFWTELLGVFGIDRRPDGVEFERPVRKRDSGAQGFIDVFWPRVLLAEQKSAGKDLNAALAQADNYAIDDAEAPRLTVVSDFARLAVRDNATGHKTEFALSDLPTNLGWFGPLVRDELRELVPDVPVDIEAAERMAALFDELRAAGYGDHELRLLLVRLLFCLFADDTRIWQKGAFDAYVRSVPEDFAGSAIAKLFEVLDTPVSQRSANLAPALALFPHVGGELFAERLTIADFTPEMTRLLLACSEGVDWSRVSPAVFGSMFQGVMGAKERRDLGAHYTSEENILKAIEPLFLDELYQQLEDADTLRKLERLWDRLATMKLLDPAAGCGNFLVVSYRELRRLESQLMASVRSLAAQDPSVSQRYPWALGSQRLLDFGSISRMNVDQFYGVEIDEWPARIAQVAMWLTDHLANMELEESFGGHQARLPLRATASIAVGNSVRLDWSTVLPAEDCNYVLGNPPFVGVTQQSADQKDDIAFAFGGSKKGLGKIDYVTCWFRKAATYTRGTTARCALVSTNSINQGEQAAVLWGQLFAEGITIDFAHRSFAWSNEARGRAAVHVVIVGFGHGKLPGQSDLFVYGDPKGKPERRAVRNINAYLIDGPNVVVARQPQPLPGGIRVMEGSKPTDGGYLILSESEAAELRTSDPVATKYLRELVGAEELINGTHRWCLWLEDAPPGDLRASAEIRRRTAEVRRLRMASPAATTRESADTPHLFQLRRQPTSDYIAIPSVSSEARRYLPVRMLGSSTVVTNKALTCTHERPNLAMALLSSRAFRAWAGAVAGRMKSDLNISSTPVHAFPWPVLDDAQSERWETAAEAVLAARAEFPESSLADLYHPLTMPATLVKAHKALDREVLAAYGLKPSADDAAILTKLFERYQELMTSPQEDTTS